MQLIYKKAAQHFKCSAARSKIVPGTFGNGSAMVVVLCLLITGSAIAAEQSYDTLLQQALTQRNDGNFLAAEQSLREARDLARDTNEVDYLLAMVLAFQERSAEAMDLVDNSLARYPSDVQLRLAKSRIHSYRGEYGESLAWVNKVLADQPGNPEALVLAGRVNYYEKNYQLARQLFTEVLEVDAQNLDALLGLHDIEAAEGNGGASSTLLARAESLAPGNADVRLRRERQSELVFRPMELTAGYSVSDFDSDGIDHWYDRFLEYRHRFVNGNQLFLRSEHLHRFGTHDSLVEVGTVLNLRNGAPAEIAFTHGDDSEFSPRKRIRLATSLPLVSANFGGGSSLFDLGFTQAEYQTGEVSTYRAGITHYFGKLDGWLSTAAIHVKDENNNAATGWTASLNWQSSPKLRLGFGYADAPETENNVTTDTQAHFLYARYQLSDDLSLRMDGSRNERARSYTREVVSVSLQFRF